jgi:CheY-like chemotaxis protein
MSKVLLLEDDRDMCMLLRTLLEIEGYSVGMYNPQKPALALIKQEMPDVVLLDVHLGGQDGIKILEDIRKDQLLSGMRVIMTSGMNLAEECLSRGADAFLAKPYMPDKLLTLLKKAIDTPPGTPLQEPVSSSTSAPSFLAKFL